MSGFLTADLSDLEPARPPQWKVWVPAPCPFLLEGDTRDRQDVYVWRRAAAVAVQREGVPVLTSTHVTGEICFSETDHEGLPAHELKGLLGRHLATVRACQDGVGDRCGDIPGVPGLRLGARSEQPGVWLHITGELR